MDLLTVLGIIFAAVCILGGNLLEGGHLGALANLPAFVIVIGGTIFASIAQQTPSGLKRALKVAKLAILPPKFEFEKAIEKIVGWANVARREGLLGLETSAESETDEFAQKGLQLLVDGSEAEVIRSILEVEVSIKEIKDNDATKFYESMGGYAPTVGIIGAVMGLIHVMGNLADPSSLGSGIATAFVATIYGVASANLIMLPMASKMKSYIKEESQYREMLIEGIVGIAGGENPRAIQLKLNGFLQ